MELSINRLQEKHQYNGQMFIFKGSKEIFQAQNSDFLKLVNIRSMTKSILSLLIGIALKEKYLDSLETPIHHYLPTAPQSISIADLLSMRSRFDMDDKDLYQLIHTSNNWVADILAHPIKETDDFRYKGVDYHLLSAIISKATGKTAKEFATQYLFSPLGIEEVEWQSDPQGITIGSTGLNLSLPSLIKIAQILVNEGKINHTEVIPNDWLIAATTKGISTNLNYGTYGYGWWLKSYRGDTVYRALGSGGQQMLIAPHHKIGIIILPSSNTFNHLEGDSMVTEILDLIT
ncbi:MAG: serine hydrolase [Niallia sp.]